MGNIYYKVLTADGKGYYSVWQWPLPNGKPGAWTPEVDKVIECNAGYHAASRNQLINWLDGPNFYECELMHPVDFGDKHAGKSARLIRQLNMDEDQLRLFACDCAERVLHIADDERCVKAVRVARLFVFGEATKDQLSAALDAARTAAWNAARTAAWNAARTAAEYSARDAAWASVLDASRDAARCAAEYSARAAARAAARTAAWNAARTAARAWQTDRLFEYLYSTRDEMLKQARTKIKED